MGNILQNEPANVQKPHFKVLVIGMSGAGKTTTINMLINQAMSIQYLEERKIAISQIVEIYDQGRFKHITLKNNIAEYSNFQSDQLKQSSQSQTTKCNIYTIHNQDHDISFIDTPGIGDSGGREADRRNQATIEEFVQQHQDISCILYVHRSTDARKSFANGYFNSPLKNILTDQIRNNFIVCFTSAINPEKIDAIPVLKEEGIPLDKQIFFENDCLFPFNLMPFTNRQERQFYLSKSEIFWKRNKEQYNSLIAFLQQMKQFKQGEQTIRGRQDLNYKTQALIKIFHVQISSLESLFRESQLIKQFCLQKKKQMRSFAPQIAYYESPTVVVKEIQILYQQRQTKFLKDPAMFCYICSKICHQKCTEVFMQNESVDIRKCKIFCEGKYEECTCSHHFSYHSHTKEIQQDVTVSFGKNQERAETQNSLTNSINEDELSWRTKKDEMETVISTMIELQLEIDQDESLRNFSCNFMKEYLQSSMTKAQDDLVLTQKQYDERMIELNFLRSVQEKIKLQPVYSDQTQSQRLSLKEKKQLNLKVQLEIQRLKEQYSC